MEPFFFGRKKILEINSPSQEVTSFTAPFSSNLVISISTSIFSAGSETRQPGRFDREGKDTKFNSTPLTIVNTKGLV